MQHIETHVFHATYRNSRVPCNIPKLTCSMQHTETHVFHATYRNFITYAIESFCCLFLVNLF